MSVAEMEMEMVIFESLSMVDKRCGSHLEIVDAGLSSEVCLAMGMQRPPLSPSSSILDAILEMALARFMPKHMEVEMGEAFLAASVDAKELEMMMVMLKPVDPRPAANGRSCRGGSVRVDMETEMVLRQHMDA